MLGGVPEPRIAADAGFVSQLKVLLASCSRHLEVRTDMETAASVETREDGLDRILLSVPLILQLYLKMTSVISLTYKQHSIV